MDAARCSGDRRRNRCVTRALAAALPDARIVATDLNAPMLKQAASRQANTNNLEWKQADALSLPFPARSFDLLVCQFGIMFFPDRIRAYKEALRVLKPGAPFLFNVWDAIAENDFADVVTQALAELFPNDPPRFLARTPHGHHDTEAVRSELAAAGFTRIAVEPMAAVSKAASPREPAIAYCQGTPLRNEIEARDPARLQAATDHAAAALARRFGPGPIEGRIRAFVFTARA